MTAALPFRALGLFFSRPKIFLLGVFPGLFTFAGSCVLVYLLWLSYLQFVPLYISLTVMALSFLLSWLVIGKIALIPVEDALIDECQRALWGEVRLPAPPLKLGRLLREALYSLVLAASGIGLVLLAFIPIAAPLQLIVASWISAYGFLATIYARRLDSARGRLTIFFGHPISNLVLGAFLNVLLFVPVLNVFLLGYAQVLATLLYFAREQAELTRA